MLVIEILAKGTVLLALAFTLAAALREASAATRHLVWAVGLLGLLALPFLTAGMPWRLDVLPSLTAPEPAPAPKQRVVDRAERNNEPAPAPVIQPNVATTSTPSEPSLARPFRVSMTLLLWVWLAGAALVGARWMAGWIALRRCVSGARPLEGAAWDQAARDASDRLLLDTPVRFLESDRVPMPLTAGLVRPVVVVPESAREWSDDRRRAVIVHELAHVRRKDALAHSLAWLVCALWWFHPLAWTAARRMRAESERACDDLVLRAGTRASSYADHLLDIVCHAISPRAPAPAIALAQRSEFEGRMLRILSPNARRHGLSALKAAGIAAAFAGVAVPLAAIGTVPPGVPSMTETLLDAPRDAVRQVLGVADPTPKEVAAEEEGITFDETMTEETSAGDAAKKAEHHADATKEGQASSISQRALASLAAALRDPDPMVRNAAAQSLGQLEDPRAVEALMRALRSDSDAGVRAMAAWALGEIEDARAVPALGDAVRGDSDMHVREMAAWALGEIEDPAGVEPLRAALRDRAPEVRVKAVWALGEIEDPAAVPALSEALGDGSVEIRRMAAWALGEIEDPRAIPALTRVVRDADAEVRSNAVWALGEIEDPSAVPALLEAAGDASPEVRQHVAWALGEMEDPRGVPALRRLIRDSDTEVQKNAIWALTEIQSPGAYEALAELLNSDDPEVRKAAAHALGDADWDTDSDSDSDSYR